MTPAIAQKIISPEVSADGRVTFRLYAPDAPEVVLQCEGVKKPVMRRDDDGVWSFTTPPLKPDIYCYSLFVDGVHVTDPANPYFKYNLISSESMVHVPGDKSLAWEVNDVPRGQLHRHFYKSKVAGDERDFIVYTPPGYDPKAQTRYPVLYLLHGFSDDATAWTAAGPAHVILDNLIARKDAKPMIVVMPLGYGTMDIVKAGWQKVRDKALWLRNIDKFGEALLQEVMPQVEASYLTLNDADSRAIAGLSMGGAESLVVGLNHLDRFSWIGSFSMGGIDDGYDALFPSLDQRANDKLHLLWIACGSDDKLIEPNRNLVKWMKSKEINTTWTETEGEHSFRVWRRNLATILPMLFR